MLIEVLSLIDVDNMGDTENVRFTHITIFIFTIYIYMFILYTNLAIDCSIRVKNMYLYKNNN